MKTVVVKALVCSSHVEAPYYSVHFPLVYPGLSDEVLVDDDKIRDLKKCYAIVYPICFLCRPMDKAPIASSHQTL